MISATRELEKLAVAYRQSDGRERLAFQQICDTVRPELTEWTRGQSVADADTIVDSALAELDRELLDKSRPIAPVRPWLYSHLWREIAG
jgi:hypothetical protein